MFHHIIHVITLITLNPKCLLLKDKLRKGYFFAWNLGEKPDYIKNYRAVLQTSLSEWVLAYSPITQFIKMPRYFLSVPKTMILQLVQISHKFTHSPSYNALSHIFTDNNKILFPSLERLIKVLLYILFLLFFFTYDHSLSTIKG